MVLAKALCVVLLLHWANFGDSRNLINETISEKRTANVALAPHPHEVQAQQKTSDLTQHVRKVQIKQPSEYFYEIAFLIYCIRNTSDTVHRKVTRENDNNL